MPKIEKRIGDLEDAIIEKLRRALVVLEQRESRGHMNTMIRNCLADAMDDFGRICGLQEAERLQ